MSLCALHRLPPELRVEILKYVLVDPISVGSEKREPTHLLAALRCSSKDKHIYLEALSIYHRENIFQISPENELAVNKIPDTVRSSVSKIILFFESTAKKGKAQRFAACCNDAQGRTTITGFGSKCPILWTILPQIHFDTLLHGFENLRCLHINCAGVLENRFFSVKEFVIDALQKLKKLEEFGVLVYPYMAYREKCSYNRNLFLTFYRTLSKGFGFNGEWSFVYFNNMPMDDETPETSSILMKWRSGGPGKYLSWKDRSIKRQRIC